MISTNESDDEYILTWKLQYLSNWNENLMSLFGFHVAVVSLKDSTGFVSN